ncbi:MAG: ribonuclease H family protein [Fibrobacterales bacterium]
MAKKKFYAVKLSNGSTTIYTSWPECEKAVKGVKGVTYKGFVTKEEAKAFLSPDPVIPETGIFAYVDGSFTPKQKHGGWGIVIVEQGVELHRDFGRTIGDALSRNIDGEVTGAMKAIEWAEDHGQPVTICHDYTGIRHWALKEWKASSEIAKQYQAFCKGRLDGITFKKVAAHSGDHWNDIADELAKKGCEL